MIAEADKLAKTARDSRARFKWAAVADLLAFMAGTGCRIAEARELTWDAVDLEAGRVHIRGTKTTGSDRMNNLPEWVRERLTARRDINGLSPWVFCVHHVKAEHVAEGYLGAAPDQSNLAGWIRTVLDNAEVPWAVPHTFRRTAVTMLHEAGAPLNRIADQMGHADPGMTARVYLGRDYGGDKADLAAVL